MAVTPDQATFAMREQEHAQQCALLADVATLLDNDNQKVRRRPCRRLCRRLQAVVAYRSDPELARSLLRFGASVST